MREKIIAEINSVLENSTSMSGVNLLDRFTPIDLGNFATVIYSCLPLYTDENIETIVYNIIHVFEDIERGIKFIYKNIALYLPDYVKREYTSEDLTALVFWINLLNKIKFQTDLVDEEVNYKDYLLSHLISEIDLRNEIQEVKADGETLSMGLNYLRVDRESDLLLPSTKTISEYGKYIKK